jgi:hypothetical protein
MARDPNRPTPRSGSNDALVGEVRWQLFRRDELPPRLRRLQRLEEAAARESNGRPRRTGRANTDR